MFFFSLSLSSYFMLTFAIKLNINSTILFACSTFNDCTMRNSMRKQKYAWHKIPFVTGCSLTLSHQQCFSVFTDAHYPRTEVMVCILSTQTNSSTLNMRFIIISDICLKVIVLLNFADIMDIDMCFFFCSSLSSDRMICAWALVNRITQSQFICTE